MTNVAKNHSNDLLNLCVIYEAQNADNARNLGIWSWSLCNKWLHHNQKMTVMFVTNTCCSPPTWYTVRKLKQVQKKSNLDTNTSSQTFMPFTGASFINDCLLQPMLHVSHPLLQFADITDPFLSTAALFSRFYSQMIQSWAIKAALYLARWILRSPMQYSTEISSSFNCQVSQDSVQTHLRWGREYLQYT